MHVIFTDVGLQKLAIKSRANIYIHEGLTFATVKNYLISRLNSEKVG